MRARLAGSTLVLAAALAAAACTTSAAAPETAPAEATGLEALMQEYWEFELAEDPLLASDTGDHRYDDRLPQIAPADHARRAERRRGFLERLRSLPAVGISVEEQINRAMLARLLEEALESFGFKEYEIPLTSDSGFHTEFARLAHAMPLRTSKDYESYIARLRGFLTFTRQHIANMKAGLSRQFTLPQVVLEGYEKSIEAHAVSDVEKSVHFEPFRTFPAGVPEGDRERLRQAGRAAITESTLPAYAEFLRFMRDQYVPQCRLTTGASALPDGARYYRYLIRHYTTLELEPGAIHALGLGEVRRIRQAMDEILRRLNEAGTFTGDFQAFLNFLRTDPRFYASSPEELVRTASHLAKRADGALPSLFKTLPRQPYTVEAVPEGLAPKYTTGRYIGAAPDSGEPGRYWVNTYDLPSRPLYVLPALTLHEAVPGHHLENALRQELTNVPAFRKWSGIDAFGEGWGFYSEWLGIEAGMYTTPYEHFGRLTYEMWRACRLVVDTGLHSADWTREQAIAYLLENTALSEHEVKTETDRYISWPGQALAYKLGELKIRELRRFAEATLGTRFDVREFHDTVLRYGPVPLGVLEAQVKRYVQSATN